MPSAAVGMYPNVAHSSFHLIARANVSVHAKYGTIKIDILLRKLMALFHVYASLGCSSENENYSVSFSKVFEWTLKTIIEFRGCRSKHLEENQVTLNLFEVLELFNDELKLIELVEIGGAYNQ